MRGRSHGFTLAEVLIAVAILAMIGTLTFGSYSRVLEGRDDAQEIADFYHEIRQAMSRMSREISTAFLSNRMSCIDPQSRTIFETRSSTHGMRLNFVSFSNVKFIADANVSDQQELSYYVDSDPTEGVKGTALLRRAQANLDNDPDEGGDVEVLATGVQELTFRFYDMKDDRWEDSWSDQDLKYRDRGPETLPLFVEIKIKAKDPMNKEQTFITKTRIHIREPLVGNGPSVGGRCPQ